MEGWLFRYVVARRVGGQELSEPKSEYPFNLEGYFALQHRLPMWTIYRPITKDYPGKWLARLFLTMPEEKPTRLLIVGDSLEEVRRKLPPGLAKLSRDENDDPVIEEVWL